MRDLPQDSPLRYVVVDVAPRINELLAPLVPWHNRAVEPTEGDFYEWYFGYGAVLRPRIFLEIGVLGGASIVALCLGAGSVVGHVVLMDDESHDRPVSLADAEDSVHRVVPRARIESFKEDTQRLAQLPPGPLFDLISIDGDHRVGPCYHDLRICLPRLAPEGHILVDDAQWCWVKDACDAFLCAHPELDDLFVRTKTGTRILHFGGDHLQRCPLLGSSTRDLEKAT